MIGHRVRIALFIVVAFTLQATLLGGLRLGGIAPDAMLLVPIAFGIAAGPERGAVVGFAAGLVADLFLQTPFGLSALTYSLVGFAVGSVQGNVIHAAWWIAPATALVGSAAGVIGFALLGVMVGQDHLMTTDLPLIAAAVALLNAPLSVPAVRAAAWAVAPADSLERLDRSYAR